MIDQQDTDHCSASMYFYCIAIINLDTFCPNYCLWIVFVLWKCYHHLSDSAWTYSLIFVRFQLSTTTAFLFTHHLRYIFLFYLFYFLFNWLYVSYSILIIPTLFWKIIQIIHIFHQLLIYLKKIFSLYQDIVVNFNIKLFQYTLVSGAEW